MRLISEVETLASVTLSCKLHVKALIIFIDEWRLPVFSWCTEHEIDQLMGWTKWILCKLRLKFLNEFFLSWLILKTLDLVNLCPLLATLIVLEKSIYESILHRNFTKSCLSLINWLVEHEFLIHSLLSFELDRSNLLQDSAIQNIGTV